MESIQSAIAMSSFFHCQKLYFRGLEMSKHLIEYDY